MKKPLPFPKKKPKQTRITKGKPKSMIKPKGY